MNFRLFCVIVLLQLVSARYDFLPKFFGQDSAVIVDVNRAVHAAPTYHHQQQQHHHQQQQRHHQQQQQHHHQQQQQQRNHHLANHFRSPPMRYPAYQIIPNNNRKIQDGPSKPTETPAAAASTTTIATSVSIFTKEEFPNDLVDIARNKLGIKNLDEIPSISELGELLGTQSADETIKYIRELTATDEGIEFVKAYIESTDYTDSTGTVTRTGTGTGQENAAATPPAEAKPTDVVTAETPQASSPPPTPSLYERLSAYLNVFDLFTAKTATTPTSPKGDKDDMDMALQRIDRITAPEKPPRQIFSVGGNNKKNVMKSHNNAGHKPILVRNPLPYHYPIPIRPVVVYRPRGAAAASPFNNLQSPPVHLNTPKRMVPLEMAGVRAKSLQFVDSAAVSNAKKQLQHKQQQKQQQKQLNDLAARVSKFPLTNDREAIVGDQHANAIEKALAEDEDLKNILGSTETLK